MLFVFLLLAQTVAVMHRVAHAKGSGEHIASEVVEGVNSLWSHHSNSFDCQSFDLNNPDLSVLSAWDIPLNPLVPVWTVIHLQTQFSNFERFYSAQAPPASLK